MKARILITTTLAILITTALAAQSRQPVRRTIVVKDGKVIAQEGDVIPLAEFLGGKRAWVGVSLIDISPELREHFGASKDAGVLVESVADGSPAEKAGIRVGDVIVAVDGKDVKWSGDVRGALRDKKDGDAVRIETVRNRARQTAVVTVTEHENRSLFPGDFLPRTLNAPEWRAHVENLQSLQDCGDLQTRIKDLESRLKDLEKKLQK